MSKSFIQACGLPATCSRQMTCMLNAYRPLEFFSVQEVFQCPFKAGEQEMPVKLVYSEGVT